MTGLYSGTTLITRYLRVVRQVAPRKIISTLLDGSDHVQILGTGPTRVHAELLADITGRNLIDTLDASGGLVTLNDEDGQVYTGRILDKAEWSKMIKGRFQTSITISVEAVT